MILLAGVGYYHMSDLSFGPTLVERLRTLEWPDEVQIEDLSYGPIPIIHWFEDHPGRFDRAIFAGAMDRGNEPGALSTYAWGGNAPDPERVQERVAEAVTGVISLENLLIIADYFGVLPDQTTVVELEPVDLEWGLELSAHGEKRLHQTIKWIQEQISYEKVGSPHPLPVSPGNGRA